MTSDIPLTPDTPMTSVRSLVPFIAILFTVACESSPMAPQSPSYEMITVQAAPQPEVTIKMGRSGNNQVLLCVPRGTQVDMLVSSSEAMSMGWSVGDPSPYRSSSCADGRDLVAGNIDFFSDEAMQTTVRLTFVFSRGNPLVMSFKIIVK